MNIFAPIKKNLDCGAVIGLVALGVTLLTTSLPPTLGYLFIVIGVLGVFFLYRQNDKPVATPKQEDSSVEPSEEIKKDVLSQSELLLRFERPQHKLKTKIYDEFALVDDKIVNGAFKAINDRRRSKGLVPFYESVLYRIIAPPTLLDDNKVIFHLAPIGFPHLAVLSDEETNPDVKEYIRKKVKEFDKIKLPQEIRDGNDPHLNLGNLTPTGVEVVCITPKDQKVLLRKRGRHVLMSAGELDVSVSGYCTHKHFVNGSLVFDGTVHSETEAEIDVLKADPKNIIFTGLHRNKSTGAIDLLAYWELGISSGELGRKINKDYPGENVMFPTTEDAPEPFVGDYMNIVISYDATQISSVLSEIGVGVASFVPEALCSLTRSLEVRGKPTKGLI